MQKTSKRMSTMQRGEKMKAMQRGEKSVRKKHERQPSCIEGGIWKKGCK